MRELAVSAKKNRSCDEKEEILLISTLVVVRAVAQYRRTRDNKRWRDSHKPVNNRWSAA